MNSLSGSSLRAYRWLALGVFAGVILADVLSARVSPILAWLAGGAVIGLVPAGFGEPRSTERVLITVVSTACVAALAHWLANLIL